MPIDPATETTVTLADLQDIRATLISVHNCLASRDLSDSAANLLGEVRYRPLTTEVERVATRVKGLIADLILGTIDDVDEPMNDPFGDTAGEFGFDFEPDEVDEIELDDPGVSVEEVLSENPLGSRTITPRGPQFDWDEGESDV